jgi:hypothetical protein
MQSEMDNPEAVATLDKKYKDDDKQTQKYNIAQKTKKMSNNLINKLVKVVWHTITLILIQWVYKTIVHNIGLEFQQNGSVSFSLDSFLYHRPDLYRICLYICVTQRASY